MLDEFKPLIKNKKFIFLWTSQILSQFTINILNFLFLVRIFEATGSTIAASFLWVAYALPAILIGPFAAASVDMVDRRKLLIIANLLQCLTVLLYAISHKTSLFLLYGVAVLYSFLNQFYVPAEVAVLPSLLRKSNLAQANGLFFITQQVAVVVGFGVAGILGGIFGFAGALYLCSLFLLGAFISVTRLPRMETSESVPKKFEKAFVKFFQRIMEGYRYIKDNNLILFPLILLFVMNMSLNVVIVNIPILATQIFKINMNFAGLLVAVPAGLGAGTGALITPKMLKKGWRKVRTIEVFFMVLTLALFILTFVVPEISGLQKLMASILTIFLVGFTFVGIVIPIQTFLQETIPGGLRGRVFGNYWFLATVATVFPVIFSGTITELFGARMFIFLLAMGSLLTLVFINKSGREFISSRFSLNG